MCLLQYIITYLLIHNIILSPENSCSPTGSVDLPLFLGDLISSHHLYRFDVNIHLSLFFSIFDSPISLKRGTAGDFYQENASQIAKLNKPLFCYSDSDKVPIVSLSFIVSQVREPHHVHTQEGRRCGNAEGLKLICPL